MKHENGVNARRWMVLSLLFAVHCSLFMSRSVAQSFTQRIQQEAPGQGTVTIHQSAEIDKLVNDPNATGQPPQKTEDKKPTVEQPKPNGSQPPAAAHVAGKPTGNNGNTGGATVAEPDGQKKVMQNGRKITGYRVQAFAGGNSRKDRQMAEQTRDNIKAHFANVPVYVHFYSPRWICRVGNYRTYEEAHQMMVSLQNLGYKQASVVKGKITVQY